MITLLSCSGMRQTLVVNSHREGFCSLAMSSEVISDGEFWPLGCWGRSIQPGAYMVAA